MSLVQGMKDWLVGLGPDNPLVHLSLKIHGRQRGFRVSFDRGRINIENGRRIMVLKRSNYTLVPIMMEVFDRYFGTIQGKAVGGETVLDFSIPNTHCYLQSGLELRFPGVAEDDSNEAYFHRMRFREGMIVFDVGAHAGLNACTLSGLVGPTGKVFAFEPDDSSRGYLIGNIEKLGLKNVTVLAAAMGEKNEQALFNMDGSMGASLFDCAVYADTGQKKMVEVLSLEGACSRLGFIPEFVKMDIEGAEVGVIRAALGFLKQNPICFAIESYHRTRDGLLTYTQLEPLFRSIDYHVESSDKFGEMFTWATPPGMDLHG